MGFVLRVVKEAVRAAAAVAEVAGASRVTTRPSSRAEHRADDGTRALAEIRQAVAEVSDGQSRLARHVEALQRGQEEILEFVRSVLDDEALAADGGGYHRRRVASVALRVASGEEVVRGLVGAFCDGVGLDIVLQAEAGAGGRGPYLAWRPADGRPLEDAMAAVLTAVPEDQAADSPGLDELRRLLLALHERGPGTIRIGPMILNSAPGSLLGRVMSTRELAGLGGTGLPGLVPGGEVPHAAADAERWLRRLAAEDRRAPGDSGVLELTAWAESYLAPESSATAS